MPIGVVLSYIRLAPWPTPFRPFVGCPVADRVAGATLPANLGT